MADKRPNTVETLARSLNYLMDKFGYSEQDVAKRAGVAGKTVNNMRRGRTKATIENADKVARVFGLAGWQLILPGFPQELLENGELKAMLEHYAEADTEGRHNIARIAEREAAFSRRKTSE